MVANPHVSTDASIDDFLAALASADPAYSAVSASAMAAAMGASLLVMVTGLPKTRGDTIDDRRALTEAAVALSGLQRQLIEAIDTETALKIFAAENMPQRSATQRAERDAAIQFAQQGAADVPIEVMRLATLGLKHAETVAARSCRAASNDVELAIVLLRTGLSGARANLETKLSSLTDVVYVKAVVDEVAVLSEDGARSADTAHAFIRLPPA
jgi:formiminotetrahydrofolate cyclodeaminase